MTRTIGTLMLTAAMLAGPAGAARAQDTQPQGVFPFRYRLVELDNGLKAYLIDAGAPNQVAYVSVVRTGSRDEWEPGRSGFAHFFEHIMFNGTKKYPDYDGATTEMGAVRNGTTTIDRTIYYVVASNKYLEKIVDVESDRFMHQEYSEADFRRQAGAVLGEYQQSATTPNGFLNEKVHEAAFDTHTYRHTTIGYEADVRAMPDGYEYSKTFYQRYYRPENVVIVVTGDFDFDTAERLIRQYYGGWERGYVPPQITPEPAHTAPRDVTVTYPGRTVPMLAVNYLGPAWSSTDRIAVATEVLGQVAFGQTSDIYRRLVIDERKVQSLSNGFRLTRDPNLLTILAAVVDPADIGLVRQAIADTVAGVREQLVDAKRLAEAKRFMKYSFLMGLETAQDVAFAMVPWIASSGGIEAIDTYFRTLDAVTAEDVREAARRFLVENQRTTVTMLQQESGR